MTSLCDFSLLLSSFFAIFCTKYFIKFLVKHYQCFCEDRSSLYNTSINSIGTTIVYADPYRSGSKELSLIASLMVNK